MDFRFALMAYLVLLSLEFLANGLLVLLNLRQLEAQGGRVPPELAASVDERLVRRSAAYTRDRSLLGLARGLASFVGLGLLAAGGAYGRLESVVSLACADGWAAGPAFLLVLALLSRLAGLPLELFSQFVIEQKHGFNRQTPALFLADELKGLAVSLLLAAPLLTGLLALLEAGGSWWWLWAWAAVTCFQFGLTVLYPLLIAPLFNKFAPLEDGPLKSAVNEQAERLGFRIGGVYLMDGSRRSAHSNAYFTGFAAGRRVVLYDTLIKTMDQGEILAVLAHEIGHYRLRHLQAGFLVQAVLLLAGLAGLEALRGWAALYPAFGFERPIGQALLLIASLFAGPLAFLGRPALMAWSRGREYAADRYAARAAGTGAGLAGALIKLNRDNLANLVPHPWYSFFNYSHPTLLERLRALAILEGGVRR